MPPLIVGSFPFSAFSLNGHWYVGIFEKALLFKDIEVHLHLTPQGLGGPFKPGVVVVKEHHGAIPAGVGADV